MYLFIKGYHLEHGLLCLPPSGSQSAHVSRSAQMPVQERTQQVKAKAKGSVKWVFGGRLAATPHRVSVPLLSSPSGLGTWERTRRGGSWGTAVTGKGGGGAVGVSPAEVFSSWAWEHSAPCFIRQLKLHPSPVTESKSQGRQLQVGLAPHCRSRH